MTEDTVQCDSCGKALVRGQPVVFAGLGRIYCDELELLESSEIFCSTDCLAGAVVKCEAANLNLPTTPSSS